MNKQELIKEYESIVKDDSLELCGCYNMADKIFMRKIYKSVLEDLEHLDEPQPIKSKDIIARIKSLDVGIQEVWLNKILKELGSDYGSLKYRAGYEQGRFDCAMEREKVTVPQFVGDWIERSKQEKRNLRNALNNGGEKMRLWFLDQENYDLFARAWLDGYEIEKEKRYLVKMKGVEDIIGFLNFGGITKTWFMGDEINSYGCRTHHTRKELEEGDFGWVFDCPGVEVEEVEK